MPIGYKVVDGRIIVCKEKSKIVEQIFKEYDCGTAATKIAAGLKERGICNGNGKVSWTHVSIGRILENPNYLGNEYYPQIIEKDLFDRVQKRREGVRAELGRAEHRPGKDERILFGGAVWCQECGAMCTRIQRRNKYGTTAKWKCKGYLYGKQEKCRDRAITDEQIKQVCVDAINAVVQNQRLLYKKEPEEVIRPEYRRLDRKIAEMKESGASEKEFIQALYQRAEERYRSLSVKDTLYKTEEIRNILTGQEEIDEFDRELYRKLILKIYLCRGNVAEVEFLNGGCVKVGYTDKKPGRGANEHNG
jgi:hypothetical protein